MSEVDSEPVVSVSVGVSVSEVVLVVVTSEGDEDVVVIVEEFSSFGSSTEVFVEGSAGVSTEACGLAFSVRTVSSFSSGNVFNSSAVTSVSVISETCSAISA